MTGPAPVPDQFPKVNGAPRLAALDQRGCGPGWPGSLGRRFVVATKAVNKVGPNPWDQGASRKHLLDAIDLSLKRLATLMVIIRRIYVHRLLEGKGFRRSTRDVALMLRVPAPEGGVVMVEGLPVDLIAMAERAAGWLDHGVSLVWVGRPTPRTSGVPGRTEDGVVRTCAGPPRRRTTVPSSAVVRQWCDRVRQAGAVGGRRTHHVLTGQAVRPVCTKTSAQRVGRVGHAGGGQRRITLEPYVLHIRRKNVEFVQGIADEDRWTMGLLTQGDVGSTGLDFEIEEKSADEPDDGGIVRKDANDIGAAADLAVAVAAVPGGERDDVEELGVGARDKPPGLGEGERERVAGERAAHAAAQEATATAIPRWRVNQRDMSAMTGPNVAALPRKPMTTP